MNNIKPVRMYDIPNKPPVVGLPVYKSKASPEQQAETMQIVYQQLKYFKVQEEDKVPLEHSRVRCPCLRLVKYKNAYKCLYCGVWFCKSCAEKHFGMRVNHV